MFLPLGAPLLEDLGPPLGEPVVAPLPARREFDPAALDVPLALEVVEKGVERGLAQGQDAVGSLAQRFGQFVSVHVPPLEHLEHGHRTGAADQFPFDFHRR